MVNFETILAPVKINGISMNGGEEKVLSIPCTDWSQMVVKEFQVYEVSNSGKGIMRYKPEYLTFRKKGYGEMDNLYKIEKPIILNFREDLTLFLNDRSFNSIYRERISNYVNYMVSIGIWEELPNDDKMVFFLSDDCIELKNSPIPYRNNSQNKYYELNKLLNSTVV